MRHVIEAPEDIQAESFRIVESYLKGMDIPAGARDVVKRVVHATADPSYAARMIFHPSAIAAAMKAVRSGADIIVDVNMIKAGINKAAGAAFGCKVICRLSSSAVRKKARELGTTRSRIAMRASVALMKGAIVVIGNAPTALFEAIDLVREKKARPALIVGVPVGFVGASESKAALAAVKEVPFITCRGRKGGAAVACAIVNALLLMGRR